MTELAFIEKLSGTRMEFEKILSYFEIVPERKQVVTGIEGLDYNFSSDESELVEESHH